MKTCIDLSENNGNLDFNIFVNEGIDHVILRLAWLGNRNNHHKDNMVENYYKQAKAHGFKVGFYVYSYCETLDALKSGINFTENLLDELNVPHGTPIFLDLEDPQISHLSKNDLTLQAEYFCNFFKITGFDSGIYANKDWFKNKLNISQLLNYKIWLAEWQVKNPTVDFRVDLWQYTDERYIQNKRFDSNYIMASSDDDQKEDGGFEMKVYQNGSTSEIVYQDSKCTKQIGYLHPREQAKCYGIIDNRALIVYNLDNSDNQKSGFVKWLGGIQN